MCYPLPGPRCSNHARLALVKAKADYAETPNADNKEALDKAIKDYALTPEGIRKLREQGKDKEADSAERQRDLKIARWKDEELAKKALNANTDPADIHDIAVNSHYHGKIAALYNPNASLETLQHVVDNETEDDFRLAIARHPKATPEMIAWAGDHHAHYVQAAVLDSENVSLDTVKDIMRRSKAEYQDHSEQAKTVSPGQQYHQYSARKAGEVFKKSREVYQTRKNDLKPLPSRTLADSVIPRDGQFKEYYAGTDAKHFHDKNKPGSKFTDPAVANFNDLVALTARQRKDGLNGDDRAQLVAMGTDASALKPGYRYLMVKTDGKLGVKNSSSIDDENTRVRVERTKAGASCSLVMDVKEQDTVGFGVLVMGRPEGVDKDIAITAHPGLPSTSSGRGTFDEYEGKTITVAQARKIAGTKEVNINTRLIG